MTLTTILLILLIIDLLVLLVVAWRCVSVYFKFKQCRWEPESKADYEFRLESLFPLKTPENPFKEKPTQAERVSKLMQKYGLKYREHLDEL